MQFLCSIVANFGWLACRNARTLLPEQSLYNPMLKKNGRSSVITIKGDSAVTTESDPCLQMCFGNSGDTGSKCLLTFTEKLPKDFCVEAEIVIKDMPAEGDGLVFWFVDDTGSLGEARGRSEVFTGTFVSIDLSKKQNDVKQGFPFIGVGSGRTATFSGNALDLIDGPVKLKTLNNVRFYLRIEYFGNRLEVSISEKKDSMKMIYSKDNFNVGNIMEISASNGGIRGSSIYQLYSVSVSKVSTETVEDVVPEKKGWLVYFIFAGAVSAIGVFLYKLQRPAAGEKRLA